MNVSDARLAHIKGKEVFLSQEYKVPEKVTIGRCTETELIIAAWMAGPGELPLAPLLVGEPGVGKNHIVYNISQITQKKLYIFQGHEDVTSEDLACAVRFSDRHEEKKMDYMASSLVTAMHEGGICFIDEIAKIRPRALALLVSVLDERRYIDSTLLGVRVEAHPEFRFIAATNSADLEGNLLPEFIHSRMRPIVQIETPSHEEINEIIRKRLPSLGQNLKPLVEKFWVLWAEKNPSRTPTPREAIHVFSLCISLADFDYLGRPKKEVSVNTSTHTPAVEEKHLKQAFDSIYRK